MLRRLVSGRVVLGSALLSVGVVQTYGKYPAGLINNTADENGQFYARKLEPRRSELEFFEKKGVFWAAAEADAKEKGISVDNYLTDVKSKSQAFLKSDEICDREEFIAALKEQFSEEGAFALVLGGKSLAKSKIVKNITEEFNKKGKVVLYVDARLGSQLPTDIVLAAEKLSFGGDLWQKFRKITPNGVSVGNGLVSGLSVPLDDLPEVMATFAQVARKKHTHPVIVIDEANRALNPGIQKRVFSPGQQETTKTMLETFTALSKQDKTHTFILLSSEHAYPFLLQDELQFNLANVSKLIVAGEVPPADHLKLLTERWGMGDRLASLCVAAYGGQTYYTSLGVSGLLSQKQNFAAENAAPVDIYNNITNALEKNPNTEQLLWQLALTGFAAVPKADDHRAKELSAANLAGVVSRQSVTVGLPQDVWQKNDQYGIVAPCMMIRLMVLKLLLVNDESRWWWNRSCPTY